MDAGFLWWNCLKNAMKEPLRCISLFDPEGAHAFILILRVGPLTDEDPNPNPRVELQTIQNIFSSQVNDFILILFTVESNPKPPAVLNFIHGNMDIKKLCQRCGERDHILNIKDQQEIHELLNIVDERRPCEDKACSYTTHTCTCSNREDSSAAG